MSRLQLPAGERAKLSVSAVGSDGKPYALPDDLALAVTPADGASVELIGAGLFLVTPTKPGPLDAVATGGGVTSDSFGCDVAPPAPTLASLTINLAGIEPIPTPETAPVAEAVADVPPAIAADAPAPAAGA